jgi:hypothetical protein
MPITTTLQDPTRRNPRDIVESIEISPLNSLKMYEDFAADTNLIEHFVFLVANSKCVYRLNK